VGHSQRKFDSGKILILFIMLLDQAMT